MVNLAKLSTITIRSFFVCNNAINTLIIFLPKQEPSAYLKQNTTLSNVHDVITPLLHTQIRVFYFLKVYGAQR
jgi:hypothetical protein